MALMAGAASLLFSCQELQSEKPNPPKRDASSELSTVTGSGGEVGLSHSVTVRLVDRHGQGIFKAVPKVTIVDGAGNPVAGTSGGTCGVSNGNGYSSCTVKSNVHGTFFLRVVSPVAFTGGAITFTQITRSLEFITQPSDSAAGAAFAQQPVVRLRDALGNINATGTDSVTLTLTTPNGATLGGGPLTVAGVAGTVTFAGLLVDLSGNYTLTATSGTMTATSSSFQITAGVATQLGFVTQPSAETPANTAFASSR
jgi:trimeric autotransporter adhesin